MHRDAIDHVLAQWNAARPDLDADPLAVVGRILRLAERLERRAGEALKPLGMPLWAFDMLGALRRSGEPYSMTPTDLLQAMMLTSGAMTNRIDRLEQMGLVARVPDPSDRRSLKVSLTSRGLRSIDEAAIVRFQEAAEAMQGFSERERTDAARLLRKLLKNLEQQPG